MRSIIIAVLLLASTAQAPVQHITYVAPEPEPQFIIGTASWYGAFNSPLLGRPMANGKPFDASKLTAASYLFPLGSRLRVWNLENGKVVTVTITDRGPADWTERQIDLSRAAADKLGYTRKGTTVVKINYAEEQP
jgi:rare lipoprotein A